MAVAELLANSSRVLPEDVRLKADGKRPHSAPDGCGAGLRITNPDRLSPAGGGGASAVAHTPWDGEVRRCFAVLATDVARERSTCIALCLQGGIGFSSCWFFVWWGERDVCLKARGAYIFSSRGVVAEVGRAFSVFARRSRSVRA